MLTRLCIFAALLIAAVHGLDSRWKLLWSDEFNNGTYLDTTKWTARTQAGYADNGELEYYVPGQVSVASGNLVIKSNPDTSHSGYQYASGFLDTSGKYTFTYGRYEINAKLPYGKGLWPAHWLVSAYLCWPVGAEIDILESISNPMSQIYGTYHFGAYCNNNIANGSMYDTHVDLSQSYHTYAVEWNQTSITWFWDDVAYKTINSNSVYNGHNWTLDTTPHYIILNTAVGGYWPGNPNASNVWPQYHYIDYVRVYGWQPCVTGCVHGCCDQTTGTCKCDGGYSGTYCEFTSSGSSYTNTFVSATSNDVLTDNAVISNGLTMTVTNTGCPSACSGNPDKGGQWQTQNAYGQGNFSFTVKAGSATGTGLLLTATSSSGGVFQGFQIGLTGAPPTSVTFQTWGDNPYAWHSFALGFDASAAYHTYTVSYTSVFQLYVDGVLKVATTSAPTVPLQIGIQYEYSTQYFGSFTATPPIYAYASKVAWTIVSGSQAVCPTLAPTPTPCPATYQSAFTSVTSTDSILNGYTNDQGFVGYKTANTVIASGRITETLTNSTCPSGCSGAPYSTGGWMHTTAYSHGSYNYTAQGPTNSGTAFVLGASATGSDGWHAIRVFLTGNQRTSISFDTFVSGVQYSIGPFALGFDHATAYHTYSFTWTTSAVYFYADGKLISSTTHVPTISLSIQATYEAHSSWWGTFTYPGPTNVYLSSVKYSTC